MSKLHRRLRVGIWCAASVWLLPSMVTGQVGTIHNGDWTAGESGWTRWAATGGVGDQWLVTNTGLTPPAGRLYYTTGEGNHGWFQRVNVVAGSPYAIQGDWSGSLGGTGWAEVMLFSGTTGSSDESVVARIEAGNITDIVSRKDTWGLNPPTIWDWLPLTNSLHPDGNGNEVLALDGEVIVALKLGGSGGNSVLFDNLRLQVPGLGYDLAIREPPDPFDPPPVSVTIDFTATADTQYGATATVVNGTARSEGTGWGMVPSYAGANVRFKKSPKGQAFGAIRLRGEQGMEEGPSMCMEWDPFTGACLVWGPPEPWPTPSGWANGQVAGTLTLGTSAAHPAGSPLRMLLYVTQGGSSSYGEAFSLKLSRAGTAIAGLDQDNTLAVEVPVFAGETLEFTHAASESGGYYYDWSFYFFLALVEVPPPPSGACCLYDGSCEQLTQAECTAAHGRSWTQDAACEPNLCPPPLPGDFDFDGDIDHDDLIAFTACYSGPAIPQNDTATCSRADFDLDGDVDMVDFGIFQRCFSGSGKEGDASCAN